jgi:hypothetical protein
VQRIETQVLLYLRQISSRSGRQTENRNHLSSLVSIHASKPEEWYHSLTDQSDKSRCNGTNGNTELAQVPWATSETVADKEHSNEDGDGECNKRRNSTNTEQSANGNASSKNQKRAENTDYAVEPHCVYGCLRAIVHFSDPA